MPADEPLIQALEESRDLGFLGPGPVASHVEHARAFLEALPEPGTDALAMDLGTGGGIPGLPLAYWRRDLRWVLVDAMGKRTAFVRRAAETLGLDVAVVTGRLEEVAALPEWRGSAAVVVARSLAAPAVAAEYAAPFLQVGGHAVIAEPPVGSEARWPDDGLALLGMRRGAVLRKPGATLQLLTQESPCPARFPRRTGIPGKKPLFA